MRRRPVATRIGVLALLAGALVPLTATSAGAEPGCLSEAGGTLLQDGCDDSTPPDTTLAASPAPNANGFVTTSTMSLTIAPAVSDGDTGPFDLECKLVGPAQAHDWRACTSPVTYAGLVDGAYTFSARAIDRADAAVNPDTSILTPGPADTPDVDQSPATLSWGQDTKAPFVFVTRTGYDAATPTQPVVTSEAVPVRLNSSEPGSSFECTDNGAPIACTGGTWQLDRPTAGVHTLTARTIDKAGNASAWSDPVEFFVPVNLIRSRGWKKVAGATYFRGDALKAQRRGARLVLPRTKVGELRLIASRGPRLGKVRLRVGKRDWHVVDLSGPKSALEQYVVIDRYSGMRTGRIVIESLSRKPVVIDAVVARAHRFPAADRG